MSGSLNKCKRCDKSFSGSACPYCTVTGVDLEALLNAEEMQLLKHEDEKAPVTLVEVVTGKTFPVVAPLCKIGRELANDIVLAGDRSMSRFHFQIRLTGSDYYVEDCGSRNGTFLNGSPISTARKLQNGDILSAGINRYRFSLSFDSRKGEDASADAVPRSASGISEEEIVEAREALQRLRGTVEPVSAGPSTLDLSDVDAAHIEAVEEEQSACGPATEYMQSAEQEETQLPVSKHENSEAPGWLDEYASPELQKLMSEKERLNGLIEEIRQDIKVIDRKIASSQGVLQALLSASGPELAQAVKQVLDTLDWFAEPNPNNPFELTVKKLPRVEAVVRTIVCNGDPSLRDFEALVNQQAVIWCQHNYEPKAIMVIQLRPDLSPKQRPSLSRDFLESMRRKKVCVVQTVQLLSLHRLLLFGDNDKDHYKELLLNSCGALPGFSAKAQESPAGT
ncbi:MAG: FHA domain-containing protein [Candidatus Obscuribacterales bacterium]|nr:FHA domain-containing protein [Candidatus Obscuribacterales bacterium]